MFVDGGFRQGTDVFKALALGADLVSFSETFFLKTLYIFLAVLLIYVSIVKKKNIYIYISQKSGDEFRRKYLLERMVEKLTVGLHLSLTGVDRATHAVGPSL